MSIHAPEEEKGTKKKRGTGYFSCNFSGYPRVRKVVQAQEKVACPPFLSVPLFSPSPTLFALLSCLLSLREVHDSGFCVFRGYVSMTRFPMLNGFFQM